MAPKRKIKMWMFTCGGLFFVLLVLFAKYLKGHLDREENPNAVFKAAMQLQFSSAEITQVNGNPKQLLVETRSMGRFRSNDSLEAYLAKQKWMPLDRMGGTYYFQQAGKPPILRVRIRPFTGRYRICDLEEIT